MFEDLHIFDGGYDYGFASHFYMQLSEMLPNEREELENHIKSLDEYGFYKFKEDWKDGLFDNKPVNPPRKHTRKEMEELKTFWHDMLMDYLTVPIF